MEGYPYGWGNWFQYPQYDEQKMIEASHSNA